MARRKDRPAGYSAYSADFDEEFRARIRARDNHTCQVCGVKQAQDPYTFNIHHIDYTKNNNAESNLITLCRSCHSKTNFRLEYWRRKFRSIMLSKGYS